MFPVPSFKVWAKIGWDNKSLYVTDMDPNTGKAIPIPSSSGDLPLDYDWRSVSEPSADLVEAINSALAKFTSLRYNPYHEDKSPKKLKIKKRKLPKKPKQF